MGTGKGKAIHVNMMNAVSDLPAGRHGLVNVLCVGEETTHNMVSPEFYAWC